MRQKHLEALIAFRQKLSFVNRLKRSELDAEFEKLELIKSIIEETRSASRSGNEEGEKSGE